MINKVLIYTGKTQEQAVEIVDQHDGSVIADYGTSLLVHISDEGLQAVRDAGYRVRELPENPVVRAAGFSLDTTLPSALSTSAAAAEMSLPSGRSHHILRLAGPMHPDWKAQLEREGVIIEQNLGEDNYLASMDSAKVDEVAAFEFVESVSPYFPAMKINPSLLTSEILEALPDVAALSPPEPQPAPVEEPEQPVNVIKSSGALPDQPVDAEKEGNLQVVLFEGQELLPVVDMVRALGATVIKSSGRQMVIYADPKLVPDIAAIPQVRSVNPYGPPRLTNNVATGIIHADVVRENHGLDGRNQVVAIADTGLDNGVNDATMHDDFEGRIVAIHALGRPGDASDIHNHGTHVSGSVAGDGSMSNGNIQGMAPAARLVFQSTMDASRGLGGIPGDLRIGLFDVARNDGAHIHTNSWSETPTNGAYLDYAEQADDFAFNNREFLILFSAGNDAPSRVNSPGTAKNVLTVGASESVRLTLPPSVNFPASPTLLTGATLSDVADGADNADDIAGFSCPGPANNNRQKPDVVAPGTWILSTRSSASVYDSGPDGIGPAEWPPTGTGDEDGVWTHDEAVSKGLPGEPIMRVGDQDTPDAPAGSGADVVENYCYMGGTSMSTPITAGSCALLRQYLIEQRLHTPSAALLKALIINGAVDMGMGIPDDGQGWGRVDLTNTLFPAGTNRVQFDDNLANAVHSPADIKTYDVWVSSAVDPLSVTLVWRDPADSTIQNELFLRVVHVDSGTETFVEDINNIRNNVQKVVLNPPQVGHYRIEVEGVNVIEAVPELSGLAQPHQDYALVVSGAIGFSCNPADVVQVIDRSGSMGFSGYMEPALERAKQMVDILQINDQTGVVSFAEAATEDMALTPINSQEDKDDAHDVIDLLHSTGLTDLREALEQGLDTLGPNTGRPRAMVFMSDGKHTVATPEIDDPFLDSVALAGVKVYTIALGPATDFGVMNNIAGRTGTGAVYTVESAADLHKLHEIYYDIVGAIGCGFVTHLSSATLAAGGTLVQKAAIDRTAREAFFAASWARPDAEIKFELESPSGDRIRPLSAEVLYFRGSTHAYYRIDRPEAGSWQLILSHHGGGGNSPLWMTTAAMADSDATCRVRLDPRYLYKDQILLRLEANHNGRPLTGGNALAYITYPTRSIDDLLKMYAAELKEIRLDPNRLGGDMDDPILIKLGVLATRLAADGKDIFERETIKVPVLDDGKNEDPQANDGIYTVFFDPKQAGVAGNYQIQVRFTLKDEILGTHTCTKLIPVYVPTVRVEERDLKVVDIFTMRNRRWPYRILGTRIAHPNGKLAQPRDGVTVNMILSQGRFRINSGDLDYYSRGGYFIWRCAELRLRSGDAKVTVQAKLNGAVVATRSQIVRI